MNSGTDGKSFPIPAGFSFSAVTAGIKASGAPDLALAAATPGTTAAAMFTRNLVVAAPLVVGRSSLRSSRGKIRAVVVNSGNANCATGLHGLKAAQVVCRQTGKILGVQAREVFPSSTGIIGVPLPVEKIINKLPELVQAREESEAAATRFARAIMTTDTRMKTAGAQFATRHGRVTLFGVAKGSGMIHPQLATMLVYLFTDVSAPAPDLRRLLRGVCDTTFNCMSVDGDTSTNDTVLLLASGKSGVRLSDSGVRTVFGGALEEVCQSLAKQIIVDGEGVQHVIHLTVERARTRNEALQVAKSIAHSALVKTAWAGSDPNWGRILAAVGRSGVAVDPARVSIAIADQTVCRNGQAAAFDENRAHADLSQPECEVRVSLSRGRASVRFLTTDLTAEYVRINADYST
jgi:glutamate N-acetyltransferase / amino-acid N-acetyltransferase